MISRSIQPELKAIESIDFVAPKKYNIAEGNPLYHMKSVANETARFDLYFDAGKCRGEKNNASLVNGLLLSGTETLSAIQIQEEINKRGGFYESGVSVENAVVSVYCLREHFEAIMDVILSAIAGLNFNQSEVDELIADRTQKLKINLEKVGFLAQQQFREQLFHSNPSYAMSIKSSDFESVDVEALKEFHARYYLNGLDKVVVVGNIEESIIQSAIQKLAPFTGKTGTFDDSLTHQKGYQHFEKDGALQTAVRVGRILFNKNHSDYLDFLVLNTVLGDYFGSRLMTNIREDKGYTYGIGSMVAELRNTGYFLIATEVGKETREATLDEIQFELKRLQDEPIGTEEIELVKNYMLGQLLKSADGPYAMTDLFMSAELQGRDLEFYNEALHTLNTITPQRIQELARKYLNWEDMTIVTAG